MPNQTQFLGLDVPLVGREELLKLVDMGETIRCATLNPEFILEARKNSTFRDALNRMTHCTVDGTGLHWVLKLKGKWSELYHGADLAEDLFLKYQDGSKRFFLLGGPPGLATKASEALITRFPGIQIEVSDGGMIDPSNPLTQELKTALEASKPDILLVGFGAPKQELWIDAARDLPIQAMIGVGGAFGFYTTKRRAPKAWRLLHLEWLYRVFTEKGHLSRAFRAVIIFPLYGLTHR